MKLNSTLLKYFASILIFVAPLSSIADTSYKGQVVYHNENNTPLKGVEVLLKNANGDIVATEITDKNGDYKFKDLDEAVYTLDFRYDAEAGGVDFRDLYIILQHLFGRIHLEGISYLAADVDGSGVVDWNDYWHFLIDWFINGEDFKAGKWVFLSTDIDLKNGLKETTRDIGSSSGDTGGDYEPGVKNKAINPVLNYAGTIAVSQSDYYELPVNYSDIESVGGFALVFNYSDDVVIEGVTSQVENLNYSYENGELRVSWINTNLDVSTLDRDASLFTIQASISGASTDKQLFSLAGESNLINISGDRIDGAKLTMPQFIEEIETSELKNIYPNPVREYAKIEYKLSTVSDVSLTLYNCNGQKIAELLKAVQSPGMHFVDLNVNNFNLVNGTYIYRLDCIGEQNYSESKIMIVCQ